MSSRMFRALVSACLLATAVTAVTTINASPAAAVTSYNVTTTNDVVATDGLLSLREAVDLANSDGDNSSIHLDPGQMYHLDLCEVKEPLENPGGGFSPPYDDDDNDDGDLDHTAPDNLTIFGNGSTIEQTCLYDRVLHSMHADAVTTVNDTTITGGNNTRDSGENIRSRGSLVITNDSVVRDGVDWGTYGYAVQVGDSSDVDETISLTINDSSIIDNNQSAVRLEYGTLDVDGATVSDNAGSGLTASFGIITVTDSDVNDNAGTGVGGVDSPVDLSDSTVSGNVLGVSATGNTPGASPMVIDNSTVNENSQGGISCGFCESMTISDSFIMDNGDLNAPLGSFGGISMFTYDVNVGITISDSMISGNRTPSDGGAIKAQFVDEGFGEPPVVPAVIITDSDIFNNRSGILSDGGAIFVIGADVSVGDGSNLTNNWAKPNDQLFGGDGGAIWISEGDTLTISDSNLADNRAQGEGGAVHARHVETVDVDDSLFASNHALGTSGGGLYLSNVEDIEIDDTSITHNHAVLGGAGVRLHAPDAFSYDADFDGTTIAHNTSSSPSVGGAGILATGDKLDLSLLNSTVTDNTAGGIGAGIDVLGDGDVDLRHVTLVSNHSTSGQVANLYHQNGTLSVAATVIAAGIGGGPDCGTATGSTNTGGYNIAGDHSCGFTSPNDRNGVVGLLLSALADNGGPTHTRRPSWNSPLVNVIPVAACTQTVDQRNFGRPDGARCDVGAVEVPGAGAGPGGLKPKPPRPSGPGRVTTPTLPPPPPPPPGKVIGS